MMFCPEGFITLHDIRFSIMGVIFYHYSTGHNLNDEIFYDDPMLNKIKSELEEKSKIGHQEIDISVEIYNYVFNKFIYYNRNNFFVTTGNGNLISLSSGAFYSLSGDAAIYQKKKFSPEIEFQRQFLGYLDFPFIDSRNFCIDARSRQERKEEFLATNDYVTNTFCFNYWPRLIDEIQRALIPLSGLPVCLRWPNNSFDISFIRSFLLEGRQINNEEYSTPRGRPAIVPEVMTAIRDLHPDGEYPSRKALAREIQTTLGIKASEKTVSRALSEIRGQKSD